MYSNKLIFGKNQLERIVSIEPVGDTVFIFQELQDGTIKKIILPASYWFITNNKISSKQKSLNGNQYYKYIGEFNNEEEFDSVRKILYQKRIDYYSIYDKKEQNLIRQGITYYKAMKPNEVSILSFDIESDGLKHTNKSEIYIITNTYRSPTGEIIRHSFNLDEYESQKDMLEDWCLFVREMDPSLIVGHNIYGYDFGYIRHVANLNGVELNLGRDGSPIRFNEKTTAFRKDGSQSYDYHNCYIFGREIIDTFFLSMKFDFAREFESYGLKPIVKHLGMEKADRTFIDASKIKQYFYDRHENPKMWELTKQYAIEDSDDALKLFDHMFPATFYFAQSIPKTPQQINNSATGSQINSFLVRGYLQDNYSIPKATELTEHVQGGISFAVPNIYRNLLKVDLKSCYPSQVLRFKLYDSEKDPLQFFYKMVYHFTYERFDLKKKFKETNDKYYYEREQASKIFINSAYGLCNTPGLNFNSPRIAAKITEESRKIIDFALKWASGQGKDYWLQRFNDIIGKESQDEA